MLLTLSITKSLSVEVKHSFMEFKPFTVLQVLLIAHIYLPALVFGLKHCNFPAVFNFGDSNSDTGGLAAAFGHRKLPPPYGDTFFQVPAGRFSDGRVMIDFMAESLGLPHLSAYLDSIGSNFSHGANFATGGSTIRPQNTTLKQSGFSPISLDVQLFQYSDLRRRSQILRKQEFFRNLLPAEDYFLRALYTFDIGQNDLTAACHHHKLSIEEAKAHFPDLLAQFSDVIKELYGQGGRSFWIHNTGPLGCLSYFLDKLPDNETRFDKYGCFDPYNNISQHFNLRLKETVLQLRKELPLAAITYVDIYSLKYTLITQAKKLGFENPFLVCCGRGFASCGSEEVVERRKIKEEVNFKEATSKWIFDQTGGGDVDDDKTTSVVKSCKDPSVRINWDGVHYTEAANKWIFNQIVDGSYSDPPVPLKFACNKMNAI